MGKKGGWMIFFGILVGMQVVNRVEVLNRQPMGWVWWIGSCLMKCSAIRFDSWLLRWQICTTDFHQDTVYSILYIYLSYFSCRFRNAPKVYRDPLQKCNNYKHPNVYFSKATESCAASSSLISARMERVFKPCFWAKWDHHFHLHTLFAIPNSSQVFVYYSY